MPRPPKRMSRPLAAFTLVELLVVIGVIAVLISMLLPALGKARRAAEQVQCASNMRQIGIAFGMYTNQHKGMLPGAIIYYASATGTLHYPWDTALLPFLRPKIDNTALMKFFYDASQSIDVFRCPSDPFARIDPVTGAALALGVANRSYSMPASRYRSPAILNNAIVQHGVGTPGLDFSKTPPSTNYPLDYHTYRVTQIANATETLLLVEWPEWKNVQYGTSDCSLDSPFIQTSAFKNPLDPKDPVHNGHWNYLFVDGHVSQLLPQDTVHLPYKADLTGTGVVNGAWTVENND